MRTAIFIPLLLFAVISNAQSLPIPKPQDQRLSPGMALFLQHPEDRFLFPCEPDGMFSALVQVKDAGIACDPSIKTNSQNGLIRSVSFKAADAPFLVNDNNITYIDLAWRLNRVKLLNDTSRILSHVDEVQSNSGNQLPQNYLGTGVVVGIVDIGFQPDNPTFYSADGSKSRIIRWWHQNSGAGNAPSGFTYGTELTSESSILAARDDDGTHGTHVGGIAAGSGYTTPSLKYRGMAPDADLIFVTIKYTNDSLGGSALGDYVVANPTIIDGFDYIFKNASAAGKPAVANLSWGMHTGPHDGTSLFDKAVESLTGKGKIICGSAGNDGGNQIHVGGTLNGDTLYTFAIDKNRQYSLHESMYIDAWGSSGSVLGLNVSLLDTLGNLLLEAPFHYSNSGALYKKVIENGTDTLWLTVSANPSFVNNGKPEILLMAESNNSNKQRIRIGFTGQGEFHAWNSGQPYNWTTGSFLSSVKGNNMNGVYLNGTQQYSVGENGGTGKSTITAGSYVARKEWTDLNGIYRSQNWLKPGEISGFSSRGPTTDNRLKPDIISPGQNIISSVNYRTYAPWMAENTPLKTTHGGNDQYWTLASGTSMASPHVTGIVALMLQVNPELDPSEVRSILQSTASRDSFTGPDSNIHAGFGKVNAFGAVKKLVQLSAEHPDLRNRFTIYPNPVSNVVTIAFPALAGREAAVELRDPVGKLVYRGSIQLDATGICMLTTDELSDGFYFISVNSSLSSGRARLLVRH